jgi:hypothetical protein
MGGLEFVASIIGSLAWPGVVLVVLWYNRKRLENLPDWIDELTLPGGTKLKFTKALDKATLLASEGTLAVSESPDIAHVEGHVASDPIWELAKQFPAAAVVQSFIEVVETLGQMVRFLALPTKRREPSDVIRELARLDYVDEKSLSLFESLKDGYNAAVRVGYSRVTPGEALRYREAAQVLNAQLRTALPRVEADNPRKKEWG